MKQEIQRLKSFICKSLETVISDFMDSVSLISVCDDEIEVASGIDKEIILQSGIYLEIFNE